MAESTNVFSPLYPDWLRDVENIGYDDDFWKIVDFYLLHSICEKQSWKGMSLSYYLWKKYPWNPSSYLKDKILKAIWGEEKPCLYAADKRTDLESKIYGKDLDEDFYLNSSQQRAGYVKQTAYKNEIMSLFHHIRNGLAHGRYGLSALNENDYMFFIEDGDRKDDRFIVTARIAIKKTSLLSIREIIISGPDEDVDYSMEIINSIERGNNTKSKVKKDIGITDSVWDKEIYKLKENGKVAYNNNLKKWALQKNA